MPVKNKLADLRDHLFATIEALKDEENPMEIGRAKAISTVAQTIIETARIELKAAEVIDGIVSGGEFFAPPSKQLTGAKNGKTI